MTQNCYTNQYVHPQIYMVSGCVAGFLLDIVGNLGNRDVRKGCLYEPRCEKTSLQVFLPGSTQTGLNTHCC